MSKEELIGHGEIVKSSDEIRSAVRLIKAAILQSQARAIQMVNQEQLSLYYGIGRYVSNSVAGTTEITDFNNSGQPANSVV